MQNDLYKTIAKESQIDLRVKGSHFIGRAFPVTDRKKVKEIIVGVSEQHYDATHNCYAYCVENGKVERFNDDGEPSGTAGKPILQAIKGNDLLNILVIVTRYFGGTKLGTGGLVRAYGQAAGDAVNEAKIIKKYRTRLLGIECPYDLTNTLMKSIEKYDAKVVHSQFDDHMAYQLKVRSSRMDDFIDYIVEESSGRITPIVLK
ncbi:MAG: YigZ family protein [candidate division KSB1 bacterium]|nr:YigZ family protein [candidate division KSB1 bacterium]